MKYNKVCLTSVNSKYIHSSLSLMSLSNMCRVYSQKLSFQSPEILTVEKTVNDSFDSIIYSILNTKADIYAFSVYIWNVRLVSKICKYLKSADSRCIIILGGPEVSFTENHGEFDSSDYDYIISGEGERCFFALLCELNGFDVPDEWNYTSDGKIRRCKNIENLDEIEFVYNDENIFSNNLCGKILYYESSRGCPFSCAYCLSSVCGKVRKLSIERVFSDLDFFIDRGVKQVKFVDRTFNCDRNRAFKIWEYIIKKGKNSSTNFHFEIGADLLRDEDIELLKTAKPGQIQFEAGIQSTNKKALDECCRSTDLDVLFKNIRKLTSLGNINIHIDLIAGLPYETYDEFKKSFNDAYLLNSNQLQLGFLKLLGGAPLNYIKEKHGYVFAPFAPYEIISNKYISNDEIIRLKLIEDVTDRCYNSGKFTFTLNEGIQSFSSPFEMYEELSVYFKSVDLSLKSVSSKELFNNISVFFTKHGINLDKTLLLDFYCCDKSEVIPSRLKYLVTQTDRSSRLIKERGLAGNKKMQVKFIENTAYIIDYSDANPVNDRFRIVEVIENVQL